jgi:hypothetical protein
VADRSTTHLRHTHKYASNPLDLDRGFHFRSAVSERTGTVARSLADLEDVLSRCDRSVLRHHCPRHDFSRWVGDVLHDGPLAARLAAIEGTIDEHSLAASVDRARLELVGLLQEKLSS